MKTPMLFHNEDDGGLAGFAKGALAVAMLAEKTDGGDTIVLKEEAKPDEKLAKTKVDATADDDLPENLPNEGRGQKWKEFRTQYHKVRDEAKAAKAEADTLRADHQKQLDEFEGTKKEKTALADQLKALEEEKAKWSEIDSLSKLERSPGFVEQYVNPRKESVDKLKELAGYAQGVSVDSIQAAMAKSGKERFEALEEILSSVPSHLRGKIERTIDAIDGFDVGMAKERLNAEESIKQREVRAQSDHRQRREQYEKDALSLFDTTAQEMKDLGLAPEQIAKARYFWLKNNDMKEANKIILRGFAQESNAKKYAEMEASLKEAQAELGRLKKASPGLDSGGGGADTLKAEGTGFFEGAKSIFRQTKAA